MHNGNEENIEQMNETLEQEAKFVRPDKGTIAGMSVGIAAAMAARKISEAETIRNKAKKIERDAKLIAETFLETTMPETTKAIEEYMTAYVNKLVDTDQTLGEVIGSLYVDEATSLQAERTKAVEQIVAEDPHGITPLCKVFATGHEFVSVADKWREQEYKHSQDIAKVKANTDYCELRDEARQSLLAHNIIDEDGHLTEAYCEQAKNAISETAAQIALDREAAIRSLDPEPQDFQPIVDEDAAALIDEPIAPKQEEVESVIIENSVVAEDTAPIMSNSSMQESTSASEESIDDEGNAFVVPGFTGIKMEDYALDNPVEDKKRKAAEKVVATLDETVPMVFPEPLVEPEREIEDAEGKRSSDPLEELDADVVEPNLTSDLGEAASVIADLVEENDIDAIDEELVKEAILETVADADDELKEALSHIEDIPEVSEVQPLIVAAVAAESEIEKVAEDDLVDLEIIDIDEVQDSQDEASESKKALRFTQSFMAVNPEDVHYPETSATEMEDFDDVADASVTLEDVAADLKASAAKHKKNISDAAGSLIEDDNE